MGTIRLTPRQYDVLIRLNITNKEIAKELNITEAAVKQNIYLLNRKLKTNSRAALIVRALKFGLIELGAFRL